MDQSDRDYYRTRAQIERERGEKAADPVIARVHHKLAEMYHQRVASNEASAVRS